MAQRAIADFERGARAPLDRTLGDIQSALEAAGVSFLSASEEGALHGFSGGGLIAC